MSKDIECPYCGHWQDVNHDDGFGCEQDVNHQMECSECRKSFVFTTSIIYSYSADIADCLNDGEHDYELTHTAPKEASEMQCSMCGEKRKLTDEERQRFGIGTLEDYFKSLEKQNTMGNNNEKGCSWYRLVFLVFCLTVHFCCN